MDETEYRESRICRLLANPVVYQRREYFSQYNVDEFLEEVRKHHASKAS